MNFYRSDFKHKIYGLYTGKYGTSALSARTRSIELRSATECRVSTFFAFSESNNVLNKTKRKIQIKTTIFDFDFEVI